MTSMIDRLGSATLIWARVWGLEVWAVDVPRDMFVLWTRLYARDSWIQGEIFAWKN